MAWLWWVGAALIMAVVEVLSLNLVLIMFAGGAVAAGAVAALGAPLWIQILVFAAVSVLLLVTLRPWLLRDLKSRVPLVETNAAAHVGRAAVVVAEVTEHGGLVKLAGEVWSARLAERVAGSLRPGADARVVRIDGATAVVAPVPTAHETTTPEHSA